MFHIEDSGAPRIQDDQEINKYIHKDHDLPVNYSLIHLVRRTLKRFCGYINNNGPVVVVF